MLRLAGMMEIAILLIVFFLGSFITFCLYCIGEAISNGVVTLAHELDDLGAQLRANRLQRIDAIETVVNELSMMNSRLISIKEQLTVLDDGFDDITAAIRKFQTDFHDTTIGVNRVNEKVAEIGGKKDKTEQ